MTTLLFRSKNREPGQQFIMLICKNVAQRFSDDEAHHLGLLAPHMALSYATCRKFFLEKARGDGPGVGYAAAVIDAAGLVDDPRERFLAIFQREWPDWSGIRLPDPLFEQARQQVGKSWRFVGTQLTADFTPFDGLNPVAVRPRFISETLTDRENEIARLYADGSNFRDIAAELRVAPTTVRSHLRNDFGKLQVKNKTQLAAALR